MSSNAIIGIKGASILFATVVVGIAGSQGAVGGHFDRMTKIVRRSPGSDPAGGQIASLSAGASATATSSIISNGAYPELSAIPSNFDINGALVASWGSGQIASPGSEAVGAFRFNCNAGQVIADDPIVAPGRPGAAHLHQFFGNDRADAYSTYASLRTSGGSTCGDDGAGHAPNRSAYWLPAMLDGKGGVVKPDFISVYYKRPPLSSAECSPKLVDATKGPLATRAQCVPLPNGLRFIAGYDMVTNTPKTGAAYFNCQGPTGVGGHYEDFATAKANCPSTPTMRDGKPTYNQIGAVISMPDCWDGKNLDSANHRDHMAYKVGPGWWGTYGCPPTHPYIVPTFSMGVWYSVNSNLDTWHLSSDEMHPDLPVGSTFHADWFGAWDNQVEAMWMDNCINKQLSCSGGDLGNGRQIKDGWIRGTPGPLVVAVPR